METSSVLQERLRAAEHSTHSWPVPLPGIWVPSITFFEAHSQKIDLEAQAKFFRYLASTGIRGLIVLGSNAEAALLTREERRCLIRLARKVLPPGFPLMAGVSGNSTVQVLEYIADAHAEGADNVLLLPCTYFGKQTTPAVIHRFYNTVASTSSLPIIVYNFPAVSNGIDLDSDTITQIVRRNENIVGVKLTCGSVAKINRLAAIFPPTRLAVFGGQADFLVAALESGSAGCVTAFGNVFPRTIVKIYDLWRAGRREEALALQWKAALAEAPTKSGIANTKVATAIFAAPKAGIAESVHLLRPRCPYEPIAQSVQDHIRKVMEEVGKEEALLDGRLSEVQARL